MKNLWPKYLNSDPLSLRLLFWILLLSAIFTILITSIQLYTDYSNDRRNLDNSLNNISDSSLPAVGHALWAIDKPQLDTILQGILNQRDMQYIKVVDYYGNTVSEVGEKNYKNTISKQYPIVVSESGESVGIGVLTATATLNNIYQSIFKKALVILTTQGLKTFFMSFCILFLVDLIIIRNLIQLGNWAKNIEPTQMSVPLFLNRSNKKYQDAFDYLVSSINKMRSNLHEELENRIKIEETIHRFSKIFEESMNEIYQFDADSLNFIELNKAALNNIGYTREEIINLTPIAILQEQDSNKFAQYINQLKSEDEEIIVFETALKRKNGSIYDVEIHLQLMDMREKSIFTAIVLDISERKLATELLKHEATHDNLTGLINRLEFERRLKRLIQSAKDEFTTHALCYLDLDQFKVVNDTCGHSSGDEMLRQLTAILDKKVRRRDTLARLGGDEFGLLMEHCTLDDAHRVASSILDALNNFNFLWEGHSFKVGVSIGLVPITKSIPNFTVLLRDADAACYMAKDKGRNRIHVYNAGDTEIAQRHGEMQWVTRIQHALDEDRFCLYAQTIGSLDDGTEKHYELLIRMVDDNGDIVSPGSFLPAAERYNLISNIDFWVIKTAFRLFAKNRDFQSHVKFISINLSGQSLSQQNLLDYIISQLKEYRINGENICFEITETAAISNLSAAKKLISTLKELGCQFALDDFGSGLSSFAYLKNLPVDYLKIDGMFVKDIVDDPIAHAMVKSINDVVHMMGMQTIAEFVENDLIKGELKDIGVDYGQGYGIHKPQPFEELI